MRFYKFAKSLITSIIKFIFRIEIVNAENEPTDKAVLICSNHFSNWDPLILVACMNAPIHFMGKIELFKIPILSFILKAAGAFPVTRSGVDITSIKTAISYLKGGENVCMFPQGKRYMNVPLRETSVKSGVGMVVMRAESDVLPVAILTEHNKIRPFRKVKVIVGKKIDYSAFADIEKTKEGYREISASLFEDICELEESIIGK